ncbi:hypothetical protein GQ55_9G459400 [Panicum hallii var. hallii]|uniref:Uncharacterized protein n=1 Tax=Panicum hallii var. hallii TaxID=1504633 RepID=A0A2T7CC47_9POAL|nr:hypothetical protein GQ55_9G459400 [Panicum hallii var. hallii]
MGARAPSCGGARGGTRRPGAPAGAAHAPACRLPYSCRPPHAPAATDARAPPGSSPAGPQTTGRHRHPTGAARAVTWPAPPSLPPFLLLPHRPLPLREGSSSKAEATSVPDPASSALPPGPRIRTPRRRLLALSLSRG